MFFACMNSFLIFSSDGKGESKNDLQQVVIDTLMNESTTPIGSLFASGVRTNVRKNLYADALVLIAARHPDRLGNAVKRVIASDDGALDRLPVFFLKKFATSPHVAELCLHKDRLMALMQEFMHYRMQQLTPQIHDIGSDCLVEDADRLFLSVLQRKKILSLPDLWTAVAFSPVVSELPAARCFRASLLTHFAREGQEETKLLLQSGDKHCQDLLNDHLFWKQCGRYPALYNFFLGSSLPITINPLICLLKDRPVELLALLNSVFDSRFIKHEWLLDPLVPDGITVVEKIAREYPVLVEKIFHYLFSLKSADLDGQDRLDYQLVNLFNIAIEKKACEEVAAQNLLAIFTTRDRYHSKDLFNCLSVPAVDFLISFVQKKVDDPAIPLCIFELSTFFEDIDHIAIGRDELFALLAFAKQQVVGKIASNFGNYQQMLNILRDGVQSPMFANYFIFQDVYVHGLIQMGSLFFNHDQFMLSAAEELGEYFQSFLKKMHAIPQQYKRFHFAVAEKMISSLANNVAVILHGTDAQKDDSVTDLVKLYQLCGDNTCKDILNLKKVIIRKLRDYADALRTKEFHTSVLGAVLPTQSSVLSTISLFKEVFESDKAALVFFSQMLRAELHESALSSLTWSTQDLERRAAILQCVKQVLPEFMIDVVSNRVEHYTHYGLKTSLDLFSYLELIDPEVIRSYALKMSIKDRENLWYAILRDAQLSSEFWGRLSVVLERMYGTVERGYIVLTQSLGLSMSDDLYSSLTRQHFLVRQKIKNYLLTTRPEILLNAIYQQVASYLAVPDMRVDEFSTYVNSLDASLRSQAFNNPHQLQTLFSRVDSEHFGLLQVLIDGGLSFDCRSDGNRTALMEAVERGDKMMFEFLIAGGANITLADDTDKTVFDYALRLLDYDFYVDSLTPVYDDAGTYQLDIAALMKLQDRIKLRSFFVEALARSNPDLINRLSSAERLSPFVRWCLSISSYFLDEEDAVNDFIEDDMKQVFDDLCRHGMDLFLTNVHGFFAFDIADELSLIRLRDHVCHAAYSRGDYISEQEAMEIAHEFFKRGFPIEQIDACGRQVRLLFHGKDYYKKLRSEIVDLLNGYASSATHVLPVTISADSIIDASGNGSFMTYESYLLLVAHGMLHQVIKTQLHDDAADILALKREVGSVALYVQKLIATRKKTDESNLLITFEDYPCKDVFSQEGLRVSLSSCMELLAITQPSVSKDSVVKALSSSQSLQEALVALACLSTVEIEGYLDLFNHGLVDLEMIMHLANNR